MADVHDDVDAQEEEVAAVVAEVLDEVADEFARGLAGATELVAARFSVSRIAGMFTSRMPRIVRRLLGVSEQAANSAAEDVGEDLPDGWDDLPGRYDDGTLPPAISEYVDVTEHLLRAVGDRLAEAARDELAAGVDAGDDMEALRARLRDRFAREGSQLGDGREERVARTESGRAWNTATLGAAQAMTGPDRPLVKQWLTRRDDRVRHDHADVNGQLRLLDEPFTVGGVEMSAPHDPTAPAKQVVNCFPGDTLVQAPSGIRHIYRRRYEGPLIEIHTVDGGKLAGTPNHPLLTDTGWQPMQGVQVGDKLIGAPVGVRVGSGEPDVEHGPTSLSELYRAAHEAGCSTRVVRGGVDFHGDVADGDVEVVSLYGDLCAYVDVPGPEGVDDALLGGPGGGPRDLSRTGDREGPSLPLGGPRPGVTLVAPTGAVCGGGEGCALLEREALHAQPVGLAPAADGHSTVGETAADHVAGDAEGAGQGQLGLTGHVPADDRRVIHLDATATGSAYGVARSADRHPSVDQGAADHAPVALVDPSKVHEGLAGLVTLHEVSDVKVRHFSGHVYNLETEQGWYIANDIASHNCRCLLAVERAPADPVASVLRQVPGVDEAAAARIVAWDRPNYTPAAPSAVESQAPVGAALTDARPTWLQEADTVIQQTLAAGGVPDAHSYRLTFDTSPLPILAADVQAAAVEHTGAMIALVPTEEDAERLALDDGEPADELHLTLWFLGEGADWGEDQRRELIANVTAAAANLPRLTAYAFGVNHWNPGSDSPSWVWAVGDDRDAPASATTLHEMRSVATYALEDGHNNPELPVQHSPWSPHVCAVYDVDSWPLEPMTERVGEITFDRIRIAFAGEHTDITLGSDVSAADVRHHGAHDANRNTSPGAPRHGGTDHRGGSTPAERLPTDDPHAVQGSPVGVDSWWWSGQRDQGDRGRVPGATDRAGRGRTPHLRDAEVRGGNAPGGPAVPGSQRPPRGEPGAVPVLGTRPAVRPPGADEGMGGMPGMSAGGEPTVRRPQAGRPTESEVQPRDDRQEGGQREGPPQYARAQGQGGRSTASAASQAEGPTGDRAEGHLRPPGGPGQEAPMPDNTAAAATEAVAVEAPPDTRNWSTPDDTALAFEDMETGDGRLFVSGALSWDGPGPWPLQHADEMLMGHQGAELAGAINTVARDGQRITGSGVLYLSRPAGLDAVTLLEQEAPLGVSVDLDDVDVEFVDRTLSEEEDGWMFASATLPSASVLRLADGSLMLSASTAPAWTASGHTLSRSRYDVQLITDASGTLTADAIRTALAGRGVLTAAAGDADDPEAGIVIHSENAGDFLMRITRARLRGATLVAMPAYAGARIVLDPVDETAAAAPCPVVAAAGSTLDRIVTYVRTSPAAVGPREVAKALGLSMTTARTYLNNAVEEGRLVRLAPGMYAGPCTSPEGPPLLTADGGDPTGVTAALDELAASAWHAMQDADPLPAEWFREPTAEELPPGSGGVHYSNGRVYGWVAQAGEPHAGFPNRKLTIESLGKIDLSHFLRARFSTDDGGTVRVGTFTMNVPHNRDGAECENDVCQFDDSRTVAGIVTVGLSKGGMWFSGAAAPWLSEWDRHVFKACQPSYHMRQGKQGWQLRAVLSVPVPGHSSPLVATAVTERGNLALAASAAGLLAPTADSPDSVSGQDPDSPDTVSEHPTIKAAELPGQSPDNVSGQAPTVDAEALAAALMSGPFVDLIAGAIQDREVTRRAEIDAMRESMGLTEVTASAAVAETKGDD